MDTQKALEAMHKKTTEQLRITWAVNSCKYTARSLEEMADGDFKGASLSMLIALDCAKMAKGAPCEMTPLLQAIYDQHTEDTE